MSVLGALASHRIEGEKQLPGLCDALLRAHELRQRQAARVRQALALGFSLEPVGPVMVRRTSSAARLPAPGRVVRHPFQDVDLLWPA